MVKGMEITGNRFEEKGFFLSDLIMTGEVMPVGTEILKAYVE
jgi:methanogenic corrinoid protein MtbC1